MEEGIGGEVGRRKGGKGGEKDQITVYQKELDLRLLGYD
jgi:hypothetical protein